MGARALKRKSGVVLKSGGLHTHRLYRPSKLPKSIEVVYQQLTQLGHTDSAVGKPKFTTVKIFPAAWTGGRALCIRSLWEAA